MFIRSTALVLALGCIASTGITISRPDWVTNAGLDVWNLHELREQIASATERGEVMAFHSSEIRQRIDVKEELIGKLIGGVSTLADTTAQFLAMDQDRPEYMLMIRTTHPASTDEESMARNVLQYTYDRLMDEPFSRRLAVMGRLQLEYQRVRIEPIVFTTDRVTSE